MPDRRPPSRPLSLAQQRALVALVSACGPLGREADAGAIARMSGLKPNAAVLALQGLERKRYAVRHGEPAESWSPTLPGRHRAKYVRAREPRTAPTRWTTERD